MNIIGTMSDSIQEVRKLLYRRFRVTLKDGRTLHGDFQCLDGQGNLLLGNTSEQVSTSSGKKEERLMGCVLVPFHYQTSVELQVNLGEQFSSLAV